jgi:hypothetical protein
MFFDRKNKMIGIIKFFNDESYLDSLISGTFYCNTPEFYRQSKVEGVSDKNESCLFSYRGERGDDKIVLEFNGLEIKNIKSLTAHNPSPRDAWLHCWMALEIPKTDEELEALERDVLRLQIEFGRSYAFISSDKIAPFLNAIQILTPLQVTARKVDYCDKAINWSPICKDISYSYQREFRFLIGQCTTTQVEGLKLNRENGFSEFILKNPKIVFKLEGQTDPLFEFAAKCYQG